MFNLYMPPFSMDLVNCVLFDVSREAAGKMSHIWSVKRSDKKIAPHLKRQEKCHETKLYDVLTKIYLKMLNLYMAPFSMDLVNCVLFEMSREATRKMHNIWSVKRSDKKIAPHLKRQEKRQENRATFEASREMSWYQAIWCINLNIRRWWWGLWPPRNQPVQFVFVSWASMGSGSLLFKCAVSPSLLSFLCEDSICTSIYWVLRLICSLRFLVKVLHCEPFYILSVKRSVKKNAPHFKCLEKRQEKCFTFQVSREASRKMLHISSV